MKKTKTLFCLLAATLFCLFLGSSHASAAYVLANSNGGDGYVTTSGTGFDLFGANNGVGANYTTYTQTAASNGTLNFNYTYTTNDCCGSEYDPAGYVLDGTYTQLSPPTSVPLYSGSGTVQLSVLAGDTYGFYVYSVDSILGRGDIAVSQVSQVPLPASAILLGLGLAGLAFFGWTRQKSASIV